MLISYIFLTKFYGDIFRIEYFMTCSHCLERERSQGIVRKTPACARHVGVLHHLNYSLFASAQQFLSRHVVLRLGAGVGAVPDDAFQEGIVHGFTDLFLGEVLQGEVGFAEGEGRAVVRVAVAEDVLPGGAEGEDF